MNPLCAHEPNMQAAVHLKTRDGRAVEVRHLRRDDAELLERMFYRLSSETRWRRFFVPLDSLDAEHVRREAARLATIDPLSQAALVALAAEEGRDEAIAVARYGQIADDPALAEASIVIRDDFQGAGLGAQLFDLLVQVGLARGVEHMILLTHADNLGMIGLVHRLGIPYSSKYASGLYEIDLQLGEGLPPFFPFSAPSR